MNILIIYYSRSGVTKKVAEELQKKLDCDIGEITDNDNYKGAIGWLKGGFNAVTGRHTEINDIVMNPLKYDLIILGSPVWASTIATPLSTYIYKFKKEFTKIAGFVTCIGSGHEKALQAIEKSSGKKLESSMYLTADDVENNLNNKIDNFVSSILD